MSKKFKEIKFDTHSFNRNGNILTVTKGSDQVSFHIPESVSYVIEGNQIIFETDNNVLRGTVESICYNAIQGLNKHHEKRLKLVGVGYKVALQGTTLIFALGFSHNININVASNIKVSVPNATNIILTSADKSAVGDLASKIKKLKYNVYTGNGVIDLEDEAKGLLIRKEAKRK